MLASFIYFLNWRKNHKILFYDNSQLSYDLSRINIKRPIRFDLLSLSSRQIQPTHEAVEYERFEPS